MCSLEFGKHLPPLSANVQGESWQKIVDQAVKTAPWTTGGVPTRNNMGRGRVGLFPTRLPSYREAVVVVLVE